jgi:hypothetical protein
LDENCQSTVSDEGILTVNNLTYVLDVFESTHRGTNNDNMPSLINGRFHFLIEGDTFDLSSHYELMNSEDEQDIPKKFELSQNFPNPFNPLTVILYSLPKFTNVSLKIFDIHGREIQTLVETNQSPGNKSVAWMGLNNHNQKVPSGLYFYQLKTPEFSKSFKMVFMK